jgi:DNA end-binding protein Ku
MSPRPIANATVSFGLVSVPVHLYSAAETSAAISFNMINPKTGSRVKQQYFDAKTGEKVEKDEIVKGREHEGKYVLFTKDEIKALEETKDKDLIRITEFVPVDLVDRLYFDKGYFVSPGKGGERPYALLAAALRKTGLAAIGQYAARGKQYLVLVRAMGGGLVLETLHYADEVRSMGEVPLPEVEVMPAELALALQIIEQLKTGTFRPEQYQDNVRVRMQEQIDAKVSSGADIVAEPAQEPETQIIDLMEALKASLAKGGTRAAGAAAAGMKAVRGKASDKKPSKVKQMKRRQSA